jgi:rRNA-processing protein FCF1
MDFLLDTSFLVATVENKIDLISELRKFGRPKLFVLDLVMSELKMLSERRGKEAVGARLSVSFLERECAEVIKTKSGNTDSKIIEYSMDRDMMVCTIDRNLKERLLSGGMSVITIRQGKYLIRVEG